MDQPPEVGPDTQQVRLATTMTGGVSLAIWMGGVARELDLLLQASRFREAGQPADATGDGEPNRALYQRLISLMDVVVDTDVISGTSAGGINGVLLATARVRGLDLAPLRDIWLEVAALETLLRNPADSTIPSLLYGDRVMLSELDKRIAALPPAPAPVAASQVDWPDTTLYVTTTLLTGETVTFTDCFGTLVVDTDNAGVFTFTRDQLADPATDGALALAARSTASFPAAFEPSFLPFRDPVPAFPHTPARPPMAPYIDITRDHWVADGGLLNNAPINLVIDDVFRRSAAQPVRRVLLYVVPSSGTTPAAAKQAAPDSIGSPYGLADGLLKELETRMSTSIADDLRAINRHNDDITARSELRIWIAEKHGPSRRRLLTPDTLGSYRNQVVTTVANRVSRSMLRLLTSWLVAPTVEGGSVPPQWQPLLTQHGDADTVIRTAAGAAAAARMTDPLPATSRAYGDYGRAAVEEGLSIALDLLRSAEAMAPAADRKTIAALVSRAHDAVHDAAHEPAPKRLDALTFDVCASVHAREGDLASAATTLTTRYLDDTAVPDEAWDALGAVVAEALASLRFLAPEPLEEIAAQPSLVGDVAGVARRLRALVTYLGRDNPPAVLARRVFDLAVTQLALLPASAGPHQRIDLVQVSADTTTALDPVRTTAEQKLTGMRLHHFGAFYKKSWRANDWMWGRVDGAGWLVHVLLDPERVRHVVQTRGRLRRSKKQPPSHWFRDRLVEVVGDAAEPPGAEVLAELAFLDDPAAPLPRSLPVTSTWLATAWQRSIAVAELPVVAGTITDRDADASPDASRRWARRVADATPAQLPALLAECPVPAETFHTELSTPLMVRTVSKAAATTAGALDTMPQVPAAARPPLKTLRTLTLGGYRLVKWGRGAWWRLLVGGAVLLAAGIALQSVATHVAGLAPMLVALVGGYVVVLAAWQLSYRVVGALLAVTVTVLLGWLTTGSVRHRLFGTSETDVGWVGRHVHWLGSQWWHPLAAIGILLLAVTLYGVVLARLPQLLDRLYRRVVSGRRSRSR